jgi:hypothetical protein
VPIIKALITKPQEATVATEVSAKATLRQRAEHELKELAVISAYLYITIGAVILVKAAVLHTEGIAFAPFGIAIVKAVVLGKFVLLGNLVHVGGRNISGALIWPTLRRAFAFLVLLVILTIIEEVVVGLFHHQSIVASLGELFAAAGDARWLPHHVAGADSVSCLPRAQRGARSRQAGADVLCRAGTRAEQVTCWDGYRAKQVLLRPAT